ncbi:MAG: hypothetical protein ACI87H_003160, partial [Gammaproteobacteria bacterium]
YGRIKCALAALFFGAVIEDEIKRFCTIFDIYFTRIDIFNVIGL